MSSLPLAADKWAVIGALTGVMAILVAIGLFWLQARRQRKSLGYEVTDRALVQVGPEARGKVQIQYEGVEVTNVHFLQVVLRNTGNIPILREDFEREILLSLSDSIELLPSTLTAVGTPEEIEPVATLSDTTIRIEPALLNPDDRITIGILTSGGFASRSDIDVEMRIAGIPEIVRTIDRPRDPYFTRLLRKYRSRRKNRSPYRSTVLGRPFLIFMTVYLGGAVGWFVWDITRPDPPTTYTRVVLSSGVPLCGNVLARDTHQIVITLKHRGNVHVVPLTDVRRIEKTTC
jgi:hypothetical protein